MLEINAGVYKYVCIFCGCFFFFQIMVLIFHHLYDFVVHGLCDLSCLEVISRAVLIHITYKQNAGLRQTPMLHKLVDIKACKT